MQEGMANYADLCDLPWVPHDFLSYKLNYVIKPSISLKNIKYRLTI